MKYVLIKCRIVRKNDEWNEARKAIPEYRPPLFLPEAEDIWKNYIIIGLKLKTL
jgi:hypothetical protein